MQLSSRRGTIQLPTRLSDGVPPGMVFVPFHWGGEQSVNRLTNPALDPVSRMPEFKVCAARVERIERKGALS